MRDGEALRPSRLRVEHLAGAFGIGTTWPRLSWWLPVGARRQLGYRIRTDNGWDSGRVGSSDSVLVDYVGSPLRSGERVTWQVKVWTDAGESGWCDPDVFELGLLDPGDWSARWIAPVEQELPPAGRRPAMLVRGEFELPDAPVDRARLYATAHGIYEAFVNGRRAGDAELTPGFTQYRDRLQVQTYDITDLLRVGRNAIGAIVSDGWFRGQVGLPRAHDQWGSELGFLAQAHVEFADGSSAVAGTGEGWRSSRSHIDAADLIDGQSVDLRRRPEGWSESGFDDTDWDAVALADHGYANLVASPAPSVRAVQEVAPVAVRRVARGQVFDLGQNINGWVRLRDLGPAGTAITLTHGEAIGPDGDVTTEQLKVDLPFISEPLPAGQVDRVVSAGRPGETFEPRHTTHGFRFVRVEGHPDGLGADDLAGAVVHTDMTRTGWFRCSDERINRLHEAAVWSLRGNACDIPTDCPTRERAGWTGDWQIFVPTAAFLYDVAGFSAKWLRDLAAEQWSSGLVANLAPSPPSESEGGFLAALNGSAGWGDAAVIVPWEIYRAYGDVCLLEEQWPSMCAWLDYVERAAAGARHTERAAAAARLVELIRTAGTQLATGFLATPYLLPVLADTGHADVAYELLFADAMPSWLYMIDRGATTVWERWNGIREDGTPSESLNHYSKGAVVSFLHRHVAGIRLLDGAPGYRHFRIAPLPGGPVTWAQAEHDSPYGRIESSWRIDQDELELTATVPPGTTAEIVLPDGTAETVTAGRHAIRACMLRHGWRRARQLW